ncbi:MAG: hypothetical protein QME64_10870, partial [bacterium]|nr:hypothetical protein [bacterium]
AEFYSALTQTSIFSGHLVHWNPYWFAGIPELQFYPIGFVLLGFFIYTFSLHLIPIGLLYNLQLLFALIFPSIAGYLLLRRLKFDYIAAFFSGLFLLILTHIGLAGGFFYGVIIGLTNSRIALGMSLMVLWFSIKLIKQPSNYRNMIGVVITLALIILFHPDQLAFPIAFLISLILLSHFIKRESFSQSLKTIFLPIIIAIGLTAFWLVPMLAHHGYTSSMQVWSNKIKFTADWNGLVALFNTLWNRETDKYLIFLYFCSIPYFFNPKTDLNKKLYLAALMVTPLVILLGILAIKYLGIGLLQITTIDPARLIDGVAVYIILVAGIGLYQVLESTYRHLAVWKEHWNHKLIGLVSLSILFFSLYYASFRIIHVYFGYPKIFQNNAWLSYIVKSYQLDELWKYLKNTKHQTSDSKIESGRILITAIGLPVKGLPGNFKTQALCLTPLYTGRQIIGGLNTPFYPVASYFYFGKKPPLVIRMEADKLDNRSLLGIPWEQMDEPTVYTFCTKLNITSIVVNRNEDKVVTFFSHSSTFRLEKEIDEFQIYSVANYVPSWIEYDTTKGNIQVVSFEEDSITLSVQSAAMEVPSLIKIAYYPCWKAYLIKSKIQTDYAKAPSVKNFIPKKSGPNSKIEITADEIGLMHLILPQGEKYQVELVYQSGWVEKIGWGITYLSIFSILIAVYITNPTRFRHSSLRSIGVATNE